MIRVVDVERVMVERGERADSGDENRHGVGVTPESAKEELHLLMDQGVFRDAFFKFGFFLRGGQFAS